MPGNRWKFVPRSRCAVMLLATLAVAPSSAIAQCPVGPMTSLYWIAPPSSRQSGISVDMAALPSGELLVLSGDNFFGPANFQFVGAGFIFRGTPSGTGGFTWSQEAMLQASTAVPGDHSGFSVAIIAPPAGDTLAVVGAHSDDHVGPDAGSMAVFARGPGAAWVEEGVLVAPDAAATDQFGRAVAIGADRVIAGASNDDDVIGDSGSATIFRRVPVGMAHQWVFEAKLTASDPSGGAKFGSAVALLGEWAFAGSPFDDQGGLSAGAVYVFRRTPDGMGGIVWPFHSKLLAADAQPGDLFGSALSADAGLLLIGAIFGGPAEEGVGYVFRLRPDGLGGEEWVQESRLVTLPGGATLNDQCGKSVALRDGLALLGANEDDESGTNAGSAYLFRRTTPGGVPTWAQTSKIRLPTPMLTDDFGYAVGLAHGWCAIGSPAHNQYGTDRGNTFVHAAPAQPVIHDPPDDAALNTGDSLVLIAGVAGRAPWAYQWKHDDVPLTDSGRITGAQGPTLTITDLVEADAGAYTIEATNDCGASESSCAVSVAPPPFCPGDADRDGTVDFADVTSLLQHFGASYAPGTGPGDADGDGLVNFADVTSVLQHWGLPCP